MNYQVELWMVCYTLLGGLYSLLLSADEVAFDDTVLPSRPCCIIGFEDGLPIQTALVYLRRSLGRSKYLNLLVENDTGNFSRNSGTSNRPAQITGQDIPLEDLNLTITRTHSDELSILTDGELTRDLTARPENLDALQ